MACQEKACEATACGEKPCKIMEEMPYIVDPIQKLVDELMMIPADPKKLNTFKSCRDLLVNMMEERDKKGECQCDIMKTIFEKLKDGQTKAVRESGPPERIEYLYFAFLIAGCKYAKECEQKQQCQSQSA